LVPTRGRDPRLRVGLIRLISNVSYGDYILATGEGLGEWEHTFGRYLYESRFQGRDRVLDVGPGRCWFTRQDPARITAIEPEQRLVDHYLREGLDIRQGSVYSIPFAAASVDGVFCCWLFEHLEDPAKAIVEIGRVLRPDGYTCIIVPSPRTLGTTFYDDYTHIRPFTRASLLHLARVGGFRRAEVSPLFLTKGGGILSRKLSPPVVFRYLRAADTVGRRLRLTNRDNFLLEAWR
jgi:SAM-dependent methyltransferase